MAILISTMEMAWIFIVLDQFPILVILRQFSFFKGEREGHMARIIFRIHGTDNEIVATWIGMLLHIADDRRDLMPSHWIKQKLIS